MDCGYTNTYQELNGVKTVRVQGKWFLKSCHKGLYLCASCLCVWYWIKDHYTVSAVRSMWVQGYALNYGLGVCMNRRFGLLEYSRIETNTQLLLQCNITISWPIAIYGQIFSWLHGKLGGEACEKIVYKTVLLACIFFPLVVIFKTVLRSVHVTYKEYPLLEYKN